MITGLNIAIILLLFVIFYQDIKDREVTLLWMLLLVGLGGFLNYNSLLPELFLLSLAVNGLILLMVFSILWIYAKFRFRDGLSSVFGSGDALFFLFLGVSFPTTTFAVIFSCSLIFSLVISVVFKKKLTKWVPLAGLQALFLGVLIGINQFFDVVNLYLI